MRRSLGHTGAVRISVLGGNASPSNAEEGEFFPSAQVGSGAAQGATWNYHEYHSAVQKEEEGEKTDEEEDEYAPVIIRGDPIGCFAAVRQILPLVYHRHDPDVVFEVPVHRSKHNSVVGKGGLILAALSAEYDVRIMVPPNDLMENVDGTVNYWQQNQYGNEAGSTQLFSDTSNPARQVSNSPLAINSQTSALPANVIQLEGEIDKCERCLVKMLSIVAGEKWIPPGVIVHTGKENDTSNEQSAESENTSEHFNVKAFAVVTATHDSPNVGQNKLRTIQRKTNTLIRRKKGRFYLKGQEYGFNAINVDGGEEDPSLENEEEEPEKEDAEDDEEEDTHATPGAKASISFLISGKVDNVKTAASQFEKLLGLEPNSASITLKDTPVKSGESPTAKSSVETDEADKKKRNQRARKNQKKNKSQKEPTQDENKVDAE